MATILQGVRVLEFGPLVALPITGRILASLGAEVIKLETNRALDEMNYIPSWEPGAGQPEYQALKRRATLDVRHPKAKELFGRLVQVCDVFITNFRRDVLSRWGIDFPLVRQFNPKLIILWQTGMGSSGPYGTYKIYGNLVQHICGISAMTGEEGPTPAVANTSYSDYHAMVFQPMAIIGALEKRRRTGQPSFIECSIFTSGVVTVGPALLDFQANGRLPQRMGNRDLFYAPYNTYPCRGTDRWCAICVSSEEQWEKLCRAMGNPPWTQDPRFASMADRVRHVQELDKLISQWTQGQEAVALAEALQAAGVPAGYVAKGEDLAQSRHLQERGFYQETQYFIPQRGKPGVTWGLGPPTWAWTLPARFSQTPAVTGPMKRPGDDNDYVYGELLKLTPQEREALAKEGLFE